METFYRALFLRTCALTDVSDFMYHCLPNHRSAFAKGAGGGLPDPNLGSQELYTSWAVGSVSASVGRRVSRLSLGNDSELNHISEYNTLKKSPHKTSETMDRKDPN